MICPFNNLIIGYIAVINNSNKKKSRRVESYGFLYFILQATIHHLSKKAAPPISIYHLIKHSLNIIMQV